MPTVDELTCKLVAMLEPIIDIEEVVLLLMPRHGIFEENLRKAVLEKRERNGGFEKKVFFESIEG